MPLPVSIKKSFTHAPIQESNDLKEALRAAQADLAALRASIVGITAKLDADAGVTDITYSSFWNPAALTLIP